MFPLVAKQERQKLKNVWIFQIRLFLKKTEIKVCGESTQIIRNVTICPSTRA